MLRSRFVGNSRPGRVDDRRKIRAHGAIRDAGPQAAALVGVCSAALVGGCASASPEAPRPTPIPAQRVTLEAPTALPEPGVELRSAAERGGFDAHHYDLVIDLSRPESGEFEATATVRGDVAAGADRIALDFAGLDIRSVDVDGEPVAFERDRAVLRIGPFEPAARTRAFRIVYGGAPEDGLFFGEDANGDPAVFADNWPNRARWWFPSNDHPADKATVRFEVTVPTGFEVIANGALEESRPTGSGHTTWVWRSDPAVPIPSYTMVIGVARFERRPLGSAACDRSPAAPPSPTSPDGACADVSIWALAGDGDYGAQRFSRAPDMLDYYTELVGPYPYEKLAHVESSTRFGGMENSSAIFYGRGGWEARSMGEGVIAHETAHQWFGDAVSPASWYHLWVSEGFASYFGPLYFEARDGADAFRTLMRGSRETALTSGVVGQAIVDSTSNQLFDLLNANNYQKGSWVLHMLRRKLGDEDFFRGVRAYYRDHRHAEAETEDVRAALERASGQDLETFFEQWVYSPGHPQLEIEWTGEGSALVLSIVQVQPDDWPTFTFDFDVQIEGGIRAGEHMTIRMSSREETAHISGAADATGLTFDPDVNVLATANIRRKP